jgi:isopentenyldiphosphate isomerase
MIKIIIVNEKDEIIGFKERSKVKTDDIYRVSALWAENAKGDILMAQRAFSKMNSPGKWGPAVAGTVEEGETYDSNITKEAEEEIGLVNSKFGKGEKVRVFGEHNYFRNGIMLSLKKTSRNSK